MPSQMLSSLSEDVLLQRIQVGDSKAFEALYNRRWEMLFIAAHKVLRDRELSRDAVQEVFADLWTRRAQLDIGNPSGYFYQAVRYRVLMHLRRVKLSQEHLKTLSTMAHENPTERTIFFNELSQSLETSMAALPDRCREVFTLSRFDHLSHSEIASKLNVSVRTVETHIHQALKHLKVSIDHTPAIAALLTLFRFFE